MFSLEELHGYLTAWRTLVGVRPGVGDAYKERELWPIDAEGGGQFYLKRLGPWRNLPVADEVRVSSFLSSRGIRVPVFELTDAGTVIAGATEDSFVLMPRLENADLSVDQVVQSEQVVGVAMAQLHLALAEYRYSANSYVEQISESLLGELVLPSDVKDELDGRRHAMAANLGRLPTQLVHGDLTPDNILRRVSGNVEAFIDFDHLPHAPRIWDMAKYLSRRVRLRWRGGESPDVRTDGVEAFVRGYCAISSLQPAELDALPAAILAYNVLEASYNQSILSGLLQRRMLPDHQHVLVDTLETARWQLEDGEPIVVAIRAGATANG